MSPIKPPPARYPASASLSDRCLPASAAMTQPGASAIMRSSRPRRRDASAELMSAKPRRPAHGPPGRSNCR